MLDEPEMRLLGLRGLYLEAEARRPCRGTALCRACSRYAPQLAWAAESTLEEKTARGDWDGALKLLDARKGDAPDRTRKTRRAARRRSDRQGDRELRYRRCRRQGGGAGSQPSAAEFFACCRDCRAMPVPAGRRAQGCEDPGARLARRAASGRRRSLCPCPPWRCRGRSAEPRAQAEVDQAEPSRIEMAVARAALEAGRICPGA